MKAPVPVITESLLEYLDEVFPDKCPALSESKRQIWANVGTRKVVDHLRALFNKQRSSKGV